MNTELKQKVESVETELRGLLSRSLPLFEEVKNVLTTVKKAERYLLGLKKAPLSVKELYTMYNKNLRTESPIDRVLLTKYTELLIPHKEIVFKTARKCLNHPEYFSDDVTRFHTFGKDVTYNQLDSVYAQYQEVIEKLVDSCIPLAKKLAYDIHSERVPYEDRLGYAYVGLLRAAHKYDFTSAKFTTLARWWIREAVLGGIERETYMMHIGSDDRQKYRDMMINEKIPVDREFVDLVTQAYSVIYFSDINLDLDTEEYDDGYTEALNVIGDNGTAVQELEQKIVSNSVQEVLSHYLDGKEQMIIKSLYGIGVPQCSMEQLATAYKKPVEEIESTVNTALLKLRDSEVLQSLYSY